MLCIGINGALARSASAPSGSLQYHSSSSTCSVDLQPLFGAAHNVSYVCDTTVRWLHYSKVSGSWAPATPPPGSGCHAYTGFSGEPPGGCSVGHSCGACASPDGDRVGTFNLHGGTCESCVAAQSETVSETATFAPRAAPLANTAPPDTRLPMFALGTGGLSSPFESALSWLRQGGRHIDTGECYGNEKDVGRAIVASGIARAELTITTKIGGCEGEALGFENALTQHRINLHDLGIAYLDLELIHWPGTFGKATAGGRDPAALRQETWRAMLQIQANGTKGGTLAVGVSNFLPRHLKDLEAASLPSPAVNQVEFSAFVWDSALLDYCKSKRITLFAYSPLYKSGSLLRQAAIEKAASAHRTSPTKVALRWILQKGVHLISVRSGNPEHQAHNLEASRPTFELSGAEMAAIDAIKDACQGCRAWGGDPNEIP